jgi:flagellar motor component MotA
MYEGYVLLIIGLLFAVAGFVLSYEYPTIMEGGLGTVISLGSLIIIVIGTLLAYRSQAS